MKKKMSDLDKQIIDLLSRRFGLLVEHMKKSKSGEGLHFSPSDNREVLESIEKINKGPLSSEFLRKIYNELISYSRNLVDPIKVAFLGPAGTYAHIAMLEIFGESIHEVPVKTIHEVFTEVGMGRAQYAVVPIENSMEGAVTDTLDELLDMENKIVAEKYLRISHSLVSVADDLKKIKKLYSHPQPLGQCKEWLRKNLPNVDIHQVSSTSLAAETASWDKLSAAISSEASARIYKLNVLRKHIEDSKQNFTRFFVIGNKESEPTGDDKTSIICAVRDRSGALYSMLRPFNDAGINMTKIESRPDKKKMWEYNFFIDFIGHKDTTVVKSAMEKMKDDLIFIKVLGSYPREAKS